MGEGSDRDAGGPPPAETVAVANDDELDPSSRARRRRGRIAVALLVLVGVVGAATALALTIPGGDGDGNGATKKPSLQSPAAMKVFAALGTTTAAGSFTATYELHSTFGSQQPDAPTCPPVERSTAPPRSADVSVGCIAISSPVASPVAITGVATINQDPYRMRSVSDVTGFGAITVHVDGTRLWETGGGNYGEGTSGASISGFANLVEGTLGPGPGALTMLTIASPNGYLNLSKEAVSGVSPAGTGTVDGVPVTYFDVDVKPAQLLDVPGLTGEQMKTIREALAVLDAAGYRGTTTKVGVGADGLIRETTSVATFADGSRQTSHTTFSEFGCAGIVELPGDPPSSAAPAPCPTPTTPTTPTTAAAAAPTTVVVPPPTVPPGPGTTVTSVPNTSSTTATSTTTTTGPGAGG